MRLCLIAAAVALALPALASAETPTFYERKADGWFFYREPKETRREAPPPPPPAAPVPEQPPEPEPVEPPEETAVAPGPAPLSSAWFRENFQKYMDAAIDNPTPENVATYYYLQRIAMDKSQAFARMGERVVQDDPFLDEITRRPVTPSGVTLADRHAFNRTEGLLKSIAETAAIWFFFRSDCPYCDAQAPLLETLTRSYGFEVLAVSIDGPPLPGGRYADYAQDQGQAAQLGVISTPALFLVDPKGPTFSPISQGMLSLTQLEERILVAAVNEGWIREDQWRQAAPLVADTRLPNLGDLAELPSDPIALLQLLRTQAGHASPPGRTTP